MGPTFFIYGNRVKINSMLTTIHSINSDFIFPLSGTCSVVTASGVSLDPVTDSQGVSIYGRFLNAVEPIFIRNASGSVTLLPCFQHLPAMFSHGWLASPRIVFGALEQDFYYYGDVALSTCLVADTDVLTGIGSESVYNFTTYTYAENLGYITLSMVPGHKYSMAVGGDVLEITCQGVTSNISLKFLNKFGIPDVFTGIDKATPTYSMSYDRFEVSRMEGASVVRSYNPKDGSSTECKTFVLPEADQSFLGELVCSPEVKYNGHVVSVGSDVNVSSKADCFTFSISAAI